MDIPQFAGVKHTRLELRLDSEETFENLQDVVAIFQRSRMHMASQETFWALAYGTNLTVATIFEVNRGMYASVDLHMPSLLGGVLVSGAERFILAHNHPSNEALPSGSDVSLTHEVMKAANTTRLHFEDHLILAPSGAYYSFASSGLLIPAKDSPYRVRDLPRPRAAARSRL
jgi:DNA repair protein RadC